MGGGKWWQDRQQDARQGTWRSSGLDPTLVAWCLIGLGLRGLNLASRPAWSDEWATVVFSLGHGFRSVPLDQLISLETLLAPARVDGAGLAQVIQSLMGESTHPPLYFLLSHVWIQLWQQTGSLIDLGVVRSPSVLFGCLTIPLAYWLAQVSTQSKAIARTTAALMAVSPFGVYLAQDARHYTLALVFSILSLGCFLRAWRSLEPGAASRDGGESLRARPLGWSTVALWVTANVLGIATHYFVGLLLLAQATALLIKGVRLGNLRSIWRPLLPIAVAMGLTLLGSLPWAIGLSRIPGDRLTDWVHQDFSALELLGPPVRLVGTLTSMVMLPAVEQVPWGVAISSIAWVLGGAAWLLPQVWRGLRQQWPKFSTVLSALATVLLAELGWILLATYGFQRDLTLGARYLFGLLPVVGLGLAIAAQATEGIAGQAAAGVPRFPIRRSRRLIPALIILGMAGSLSVTVDFAYSKPDQSRLLAQEIRVSYRAHDADGSAGARSPEARPPEARPIVIGAVYKTHEQVGEMMSLAYEWQRLGDLDARGGGDREDVPSLQFVLAQREPLHNLVTATFVPALAQLPRPLDLWLVNFAANVDLGSLGCSPEVAQKVEVSGYRAKRYRCSAPGISAPGISAPGISAPGISALGMP